MKVLISKGFGAGWSTWNSGETAKYMRTYPPIIEALENGKELTAESPEIVQLQKECLEKFQNDYVCILGLDGLCVEEATPLFMIDEYDGNESIVCPGQDKNWIME